MRNTIRRAIVQTPLYDYLRRWRQKRELQHWQRNRGGHNRSSQNRGSQTPPPRFKQELVKEYGQRFRVPILVETGTFFGDLLFANRRNFETLYSIELDPRLYARAQERFRKYGQIRLLLGDSADVLPQLLPEIDRPCLFWLDAHAMEGGVSAREITPIMMELRTILEVDLADCVILIDDARCFHGGSDYPTLEEVRALILERYPDWHFSVEDDVIRTHRVIDRN